MNRSAGTTGGHAATTTTTRLRRLLLGTAVAAGAASIALAGTSGTAVAATSHHHPHVGTRAHVPWSKVDGSWTLATWSKKDAGRQTLFLVAPNADRWSITTLPGYSSLEDRSGDGRRVLVDENRKTVEIDLHTGRAHTIPLPAGQLLGYTRPRGLAVLEAVDVRGGVSSRLERFGRDGHHQKTYPATVRGAGRLGLDASPDETADGGELVIGAEHGLVLLRNNGSVVRRLPVGTQACRNAGTWRPGVELARCGTGALWAVPLSGARPTRLTDSVTTENPFGYDTLWTVGNARYGLAENGCGPDTLVHFKGKHGVRFTPPSPTGHEGTVDVVGQHGATIVMTFSRWGCQPQDTTLFGYNVSTHRDTTLLGPGINGGTVGSVIRY